MTLTAFAVSSLTTSLTRWEYAEYAACGLVAVACFGEYVADFTKWWKGGGPWKLLGPIENRKDALAKLSTLVLIASLAGELLCLVKTNQLSGMVIGSLNELATGADEKARTALGNSATAMTQSGLATTKAELSEQTSERAIDKSGEAECAASRASTLANGAQKKARDVLAYLTPRSLSQKEMDGLRDAFKPFADPSISILVVGSWESGLGVQVWNSLKEAGFIKAQLQEQWGLPYGSSMATPLKYAGVADKIGSILLKAKIGPMIGLTGILPDTEPIRVVIGDIRTAPLPSLVGHTTPK